MPDAQDQDQLIPTLAMTRDPRLRRLFALAGQVLHEIDTMGGTSGFTEDRLRTVLLDLAPEFLPPDDIDDTDGALTEEWAALVEEATR